MANQNMQYVQGPKMDWTEDAGLHQRFGDWREEVELLMDTVLSHIKNADTKMKFVTLWAGKGPGHTWQPWSKTTETV